jgi:hypothetical protein
MVLMKLLVFASVLLFHSWSVFAQRDTGFYLTIPCTKEVPRLKEAVGNRFVCLTDSAIITRDGIQSIGPIKQSAKKIHFELQLTPKSYQRINTISTQLHDAALALVVRNEILVVLQFSEIKAASIYRFYGNVVDKHTIEYFYSNLKEDIRR